MTQETCKTCRWWHNTLPDRGACRVKPPQLSGQKIHVSDDPFAAPKPNWPTVGVWPWTMPDDFCSEHQPLTEKGPTQ